MEFGGGDDARLNSFLGGSLGGGFGLDESVGIRPSAPSFRTGGEGKCEVDNPVLSARYGTGGGFGFAASSASR